MKTLEQLFTEHGSVWLALATNPNVKCFKPLAHSESTRFSIIGERFGRGADHALSTDKNFVLWTKELTKEELMIKISLLEAKIRYQENELKSYQNPIVKVVNNGKN
jgi:hypothetical protein